MSSPGLRRTNAGVTLGYRTPVIWSCGDITADGDDQDTAVLLPHTVNNVDGADGDTGVILPAGFPGQYVEVYSAAASAGLKIYPPAGCTINGGSENAAIQLSANSHAIIVCVSATNWAARYTSV